METWKKLMKEEEGNDDDKEASFSLFPVFILFFLSLSFPFPYLLPPISFNPILPSSSFILVILFP